MLRVAAAVAILLLGSAHAASLPDRKNPTPCRPGVAVANCVSGNDVNGILDHTSGWVNAANYSSLAAALTAATGKELRIPPGVYAITTTLRPPNDTIIRGSGPSTIIRCTGAIDCVSLTTTGSDGLGRGVHIENLAIDGEDTAGSVGLKIGGTGAGDYVTGTVLKSVTVTDFEDGIVLRNSFETTWEGVYSQSNTRYGVLHAPSSGQFTSATRIADSHFNSNATGWHSTGSTHGITFVSCSWEANSVLQADFAGAVALKILAPHVEAVGVPGFDVSDTANVTILGGNFGSLSVGIRSTTQVQNLTVAGVRSSSTSGSYMVDIGGTRARNRNITLDTVWFDKPVRVVSDDYVARSATSGLGINGGTITLGDGAENDAPLVVPKARIGAVKGAVVSGSGPWGVGHGSNLVADSQAVGAWNKSAAATLTANAAASPTGATTAARLVTSGAGNEAAWHTVSVTGGQTYVASLFVRLQAGTPAAGQVTLSAYDNAAAPTVIERSIGSSLSASWQRFDVAIPADATATAVTIQVAASVATTLDIWGPALQGDHLDVFVPTSGSADTSGDATVSAKSVRLVSPNGSAYKVTVSDAGALVVSAAP